MGGAGTGAEKVGVVPIGEDALRGLRLKHRAAYEAHRGCVRAVANIKTTGKRPPIELLAAESKALRELTKARERYRDALRQLD